MAFTLFYQVEITVADSEGCRIGNADCLVEAQVTGSGVLLGWKTVTWLTTSPLIPILPEGHTKAASSLYIRRTGDGAITYAPTRKTCLKKHSIIEENA